MVELVAALAIAPWGQPLRFAPLDGWRTGASGTFASSYGPARGVRSPKESTAWMTFGAPYRDARTADPPDATMSPLQPPRRFIRSGLLHAVTSYVTSNGIQVSSLSIAWIQCFFA